jgi:hypothetical protein
MTDDHTIEPGDLQAMYPDDVVRAAFLEREDICGLDPAEQERRWRSALPRIRRFGYFLVGRPGYILGDEKGGHPARAADERGPGRIP